MLIVEDNAIVLRSLEAALSRWGYETLTASTGEEALRSERYLPAVILTGDTSREGISEIAASGFQIMHKPIAPEPLRRRLARLMSGRLLKADSLTQPASTPPIRRSCQKSVPAPS